MLEWREKSKPYEMKKHLVWLIFNLVFSLTAFTASALPSPVGHALFPDYGIGAVVADFQLKSLDGRMVSLSDFSEQKGVIVIFTCSHCPFSKAYEERINALHQKFAAQGYPVLAINPSDPKYYEEDRYERLREEAKDKNYAYSYLVDDSQAVARAFGASRTPQAYVLKNSGGKFTVQYLGALDDNPQDPVGVRRPYVENAVTELLAGKPVATPTAKPIGCLIK